jgi:hypothetical protein
MRIMLNELHHSPRECVCVCVQKSIIKLLWRRDTSLLSKLQHLASSVSALWFSFFLHLQLLSIFSTSRLARFLTQQQQLEDPHPRWAFQYLLSEEFRPCLLLTVTDEYLWLP